MIILSADTVIQIHNDIIEHIGGMFGVRDIAALESAVSRMKASFGGVDFYPDLFSKAASLLHSLVKNHPFLDGNKRTALASTSIFLESNGYNLALPKHEIEQWIVVVVASDITIEEIAIFLKQHCV